MNCLPAGHLQTVEGVAQSVEHRPFKPMVAGSNPATLTRKNAIPSMDSRFFWSLLNSQIFSSLLFDYGRRSYVRSNLLGGLPC